MQPDRLPANKTRANAATKRRKRCDMAKAPFLQLRSERMTRDWSNGSTAHVAESWQHRT
jgi:hypothetical protein